MHGNYNVGYGRVALHLRTLTCIHQMICASITFVNNMDSYHSPHVISQHLPPSRRSPMVYRVTLSSAFIDCLLQTDAGPWWTLQGLSLIKSQTATSTLLQIINGLGRRRVFPVSTVQPAIIPSAEDRSPGAFSSHCLALLLSFAPSRMVSATYLGSQDHVYNLRQHASSQCLRLSRPSAASADL